MFNHHAFRDRVRLSGVNSINWARIVAQAVYYFTAAVALGAPHRKVAFTVPTGNFGDVYAGYVASRMGLPVDRLVVATNVNDILVRALATGDYETRDVVRDHLAVDGHPGLVEFRAPAVRRLWPRRQGHPRADGLAGAIAPLFHRRARAQADARAVHRRPRRRAGERGRDARLDARGQLLRRSAHRRRARRRRKRNARPGGADGGALHRAPGEVSASGRGRLRHRAQAARLARRSGERARNASPCCGVDQAAVERYVASASRAAREGAAA